MLDLVIAALALQPALHPSRSRVAHAVPRSSVMQLRGGALNLGAAYAASLSAHPVLTKSFTACTIFTLSDVAGQAIAPASDGPDVKRTATSALVGLLYFGPALHYWLEMISKVLPGFDVKSTLLKTLLGQTFFGPTITSVFFAASLISVNGLLSGLRQWPAKCKQDLLGTWAAGLGYWPFVDLLVYSLLPVKWIPLAYNAASFFWTIYLSLQAARSVST